LSQGRDRRIEWSEIGSQWIAIPASRMKGAAVHEVAVLPMIGAHLPARIADRGRIFGRQDNGFSGWSKCKERLDERMLKQLGTLKPWVLHDLRRTMSTRLHDAGVEPLIVEALLAHKQQGVAAVYNRAKLRRLKLAVLKQWHELLRAIINWE
jgi:integrase